ncbi:MAG: copper resistance protein CopD [Verrucomicrobia bacterium]|nr:MAG: copper resistance protein CopD [Verrucomicrobiota bacterium]
MDAYGLLLLLHILGATVWTGGHLVLALTVLPRAMRAGDVSELRRFEGGYERIGIPALLVQVVTGVLLAHRMLPSVSAWFQWDRFPAAPLICAKLGLLLLTVLLAADARLRIIPRLTEKELPSLAMHIIPVTVVSVLFVIVGVAFRTGWFVG